ncbi:transposon Ty3-I Gag-Pol polyprotein [Trichonephila clavipes]|nr:transposon Ty3-I Gag-Pol polyprotein [Trichonephila clavipes]
MKQKRVGRPRFERLPNVVPVASLTDETDLVSLIRTIVREEVHRLVNQTQESFDSDPQLRRDRSRRLKGFWPQCQQNLQKLDHDQHTPLLQKAPREKKASLTTLETADFDDVGTEEEIQNFSPFFPTRGRSPIRRYRSPSPYRRSSQSPGRRARKTKESDLPRSSRRQQTFALREKYCYTVHGIPHIVTEKVMSKLPTCSSKTKSSPRGMCIGQAEPLNEGHLLTNRENKSELLRKFSGLFHEDRQVDSREDECETQDFTGDHAPINQRAYRVSPTERRIIHEEVQKMLDEGIVQPSESPWSSPIVLVSVISPNLCSRAEKWRGVSLGPEEVEAFNSLKKALMDPVLGMLTKELLQKSILMQAGTVSELS